MGALPNRAVTYEWMKRFKEGGRVQLDDNARGGRPITARNQENTPLAQNLVKHDGQVAAEEIVNGVGIPQGSIFSILTENLGLSNLSARWVPKALQEKQLIHRAKLPLATLAKMEANEDKFLKRCVTGD
nr:flj37770 protein [Hymenolepis microstoma]